MAEFIKLKKNCIWKHFLWDKHGHSAKCKLSNTVLKSTGNSTKGLHEHTKQIHSVNKLNQKVDEEAQPSMSAGIRLSMSQPVTGPMKKYLVEADSQSLPTVISRMCAVDGLPFRVIVMSKDVL